MAAGRYTLSITVPVQLLPAQPATKTFAQLEASLGATSRDRSGRAGGTLAETPAVTWSWFGPAGYVLIYQTTPVTIDRDAGVDVAVKLRDLRYFIPHRTQGPAHDDGELVLAKAELMSLERLPRRPRPSSGCRKSSAQKRLPRWSPAIPPRSRSRRCSGSPGAPTQATRTRRYPRAGIIAGKTRSGIYLVHIEFDARGTTSLIVKVPDKTHTTTPTVAKAPAGSGKP